MSNADALASARDGPAEALVRTPKFGNAPGLIELADDFARRQPGTGQGFASVFGASPKKGGDQLREGCWPQGCGRHVEVLT